jgi:Na+-transporting NADH:ubiquinone oxidoreductase subunit A
LLESGLWTSLRTRPYSKNPAAESDRPAAIFITAIDTNPLTINPKLVIQQHTEDFKVGVEIVSKLSEGKTYLCREEGSGIEGSGSGNIVVSDFGGVHPAGNVGTHIHFLDPVHQAKTVWHLNYQDVIAIGKLFSTGKLWLDRYISLAGPQVNNPRLLKTRLGANVMEIIHGGEIKESESRVISGSVFNGRNLKGAFSFLGRFNTQITVIKEGREREFLGWHAPGVNKFSTINTFVSKLSPGKLFNMTSSTHGSPRAMVPIGMYERVMPLDIEPVPLLKALLTQNTDYAQQLGCLELDEEDLALCTFVDSGKVDYGPVLRESLDIIEKEG